MKKIVLALSIGMMIGSTATIAAATNETVQATIAKFVVKLNGEEKEIKDPIIIVDGISYLPLREVSALFGYQIKYDDATRTINVDQKIADSLYETLTITPNMSEWINVSDIVSFLKANDMRASVEGDDFTTNLTLSFYGVGFPLPFEELYRTPDIAKLYKRKNAKLSLLVFDKNMFVNKVELKNLGIPIPEEWFLLADLGNPSVKFDLTSLDGVKKLTTVYLDTDKGIIRAMNSSKGVMVNREDVIAREIVK